MKVGSRLACDKCGRIESSSLKVFLDPYKKEQHLCEYCKQKAYYEQIPNVPKKTDIARKP